MNLPGRALAAITAAVVAFGLFIVYSYLNHSYIDTKARNAFSPSMPIFLPNDEGGSSKQQPSEIPTPTSLPTLAQAPSTGDITTSTDRQTSEAMEAVARGSFVTEQNGLVESVEGDALLHDALSERSNLGEGPVSSEGESSPLQPTSTESTTVPSQNPGQPSGDEDTDAVPQQAHVPTPPSDPTMSTSTPSLLPTDGTLPRDGEYTGEASDQLKRVFLVEDPRAFSHNLATTLKREPDLAVVSQTSSPAECRRFGAGDGGLDVAIVDLFLPDSQGTSLIEELSRSCPQIPLLVLTTSLDLRDQEQAVKAGADALLSKDANWEEIVSTIRRLSPG
jgi:CheY-like chemotaxis protein